MQGKKIAALTIPLNSLAATSFFLHTWEWSHVLQILWINWLTALRTGMREKVRISRIPRAFGGYPLMVMPGAMGDRCRWLLPIRIPQMLTSTSNGRMVFQVFPIL